MAKIAPLRHTKKQKKNRIRRKKRRKKKTTVSSNKSDHDAELSRTFQNELGDSYSVPDGHKCFLKEWQGWCSLKGRPTPLLIFRIFFCLVDFDTLRSDWYRTNLNPYATLFGTVRYTLRLSPATCSPQAPRTIKYIAAVHGEKRALVMFAKKEKKSTETKLKKARPSSRKVRKYNAKFSRA